MLEYAHLANPTMHYIFEFAPFLNSHVHIFLLWNRTFGIRALYELCDRSLSWRERINHQMFFSASDYITAVSLIYLICQYSITHEILSLTDTGVIDPVYVLTNIKNVCDPNLMHNIMDALNKLILLCDTTFSDMFTVTNFNPLLNIIKPKPFFIFLMWKICAWYQIVTLYHQTGCSTLIIWPFYGFFSLALTQEDCHNTIANALVLPQSYAKQSV